MSNDSPRRFDTMTKGFTIELQASNHNSKRNRHDSMNTDRSSNFDGTFQRQVSDMQMMADSLQSFNPQFFPYKRTEMA